MILMVTADFVPFFTTMAGVGATLFGLIFVVISIRPEITRAETPSAVSQVQAVSSYTALLNPLLISLLAILPSATINGITVAMSGIGLANTLIVVRGVGVSSWRQHWTSALYLLGGIALFGFEMFYGIRLGRTPEDTAVLRDLATLLVFIYVYGLGHAWDLVGVRLFHL